jgi:hypothetical protein
MQKNKPWRSACSYPRLKTVLPPWMPPRVMAIKRLISFIGKVMPKAHSSLDRVDEKALVEVLASEYSLAQCTFMLLAAVREGAKAVRLHGLWGSVRFKRPLA